LVRDGRILCTSHPNQQDYGYPDSDRIDVSQHLREHLSEASSVVALLTPYSLESRWCLFELGGAWVRATKTYPLVAGDVTRAHLPAAFKGNKLFGKLDNGQDLRCLLLSLGMELGWRPRKAADTERQAVAINQLVRRVRETCWPSPASSESDAADMAGRKGGEGPSVKFRKWATPTVWGILLGAAFTTLLMRATHGSDTSDYG